MGFSGAFWRLRNDGSHIDFIVPGKLRRRPVGVRTVADGSTHIVLYEVPTETCATVKQIKDWCQHISEKIWAEGTIEDFRRIATKLTNGGNDHGKNKGS